MAKVILHSLLVSFHGGAEGCLKVNGIVFTGKSTWCWLLRVRYNLGEESAGTQPPEQRGANLMRLGLYYPIRPR
jgi:hypothetical protein